MERKANVYVALVAVLALGTGVLWAASAATAWTAAEQAAALVPQDPATVGSPVDDPAIDTGAICRMMPECWTDADCDARCGVGLGNCVRSKCPVRVCKC